MSSGSTRISFIPLKTKDYLNKFEPIGIDKHGIALHY